jgi:prevent-host-death family protein
MRTLEIREATGPLAEYARKADAGPIVITDAGRPIAAVVAIDDVDLESLAVSADPKFQEIIQRSRKRQSEEGGLSSEEMRRLFLEG